MELSGFFELLNLVFAVLSLSVTAFSNWESVNIIDELS